MAKDKALFSALIQARALVAIASLGVAANDIVQGAPAHIEALQGAGMVDPHPDAVAYAESTGAPVVKIGEAALALVEAPDPWATGEGGGDSGAAGGETDGQ